MNENRPQIDIPTSLVLKTILVLLGLWFVYAIRSVVALFFVAVIFSEAIGPMVDWLEKRKLPRQIGVLLVYLLVLVLIGTLVGFLVPQIVSELQDFSVNLPTHLDRLSSFNDRLAEYSQSHGNIFGSGNILQDIFSDIGRPTGQIFTTTKDVFSGFVSIIAALSLTFYLSTKKDGMQKFLVSLTPKQHEEYVVSLVERIKDKIGHWMQGQLFLMLVIFMMDYLALYLLGVPYALVLAVIGGVLEIIPYMGPILSAIPAVLVGFLVSPLTGILVLAAYILIQQIENHIIVPQVMKKAVGLNPIAVILALLIGAKLGGSMGAILAVPLVASVSVLVKDILTEKKD